MKVLEHQIRTTLEVSDVNKTSSRMEGRVPTVTENNGISRRSYWVEESRTQHQLLNGIVSWFFRPLRRGRVGFRARRLGFRGYARVQMRDLTGWSERIRIGRMWSRQPEPWQQPKNTCRRMSKMNVETAIDTH